jgi:alkanesulfonate monooxygenase SsuD/methylene tetrahydromethanopterin reductase-like flavin-dependent oxidoreductase (luciferase family)/putative sterol carrier protein
MDGRSRQDPAYRRATAGALDSGAPATFPGVRFSLLYELQLPRPWDGGEPQAERRLIAEALDQIAAADRLGFHAAWVAEHHFLEEASHASAPGVVLGAASQRTTDLALGFAAQPALHHPAHLAATTATLDLVSGGRAQLAAAPTATGAERAVFGGPGSDAFAAAVSMMVESPFAGDEAFGMPPRDVVPKPLQKPHPPLWSVLSKRAEARAAGESGVGALVLSAVEPEDLAGWASEYDEALTSEHAIPVGFAVNGRFAAALPLHVHHDEAEAIARGIDGAHFAAYARGYYTTFGTHRPGRTSVWEDFLARRDDVGFARAPIVADGAPLSAKVLGGGLASQRGAIGTPEQVRDLVARYAAAGVDELVFMVQTGHTRHEHVLASLELFAAEVMPAFTDDPAVPSRLGADAARRALERRAARRTPPRDYAFAARDDVAVPRPAENPAPEPRRARARPRVAALRRTLEARGERAFQAFVARSPDARLDRAAGSAAGLRVIFAAMERQFVPEKANGFTGDIQYNLRREDGDVRSWTVSVDGERASARSGAAGDPRLAITLSVADFVRIAGRDLDPVKAVLTGRLELAGDFTVAMRLGEMFGQPGPF